MIIADSLRQEAMPEMVYAICKMALNKPKKATMKKLITLDQDGESATQFSKVYDFATNCKFINGAGNETVTTDFTEEELSSFRRFRFAVLSNVFAGQDTAFTTAAKWYLSQNSPQKMQKGETVFGLSSAAEFVAALPKDLKVDENFVNGFRYWMSALGLVTFSMAGATGTSRPPLLFATHRALKDWLEFKTPFQKGSYIPARAFFGKLVADCPVFSTCIDGNTVSASLSTGLRVLDQCGVIELKRITDAGDVWHLTRSNTQINDITDLIIKEA